MIGQSIRTLVESAERDRPGHGAEIVAKKLLQLMREGKVRPEDFSVRELWESMVGPCSETLSYGLRQGGMIWMAEGETTSTAFAGIMGQVLMARALEAYEQPGYIGDQLFDVTPSSRRSERIPGFVLQDETAAVPEGMPYPEAGMRDRYVSVESGDKRGVILKLTEEAVFLDETGQLLRSAQRIGEFIRMDRETRQLNVFTGTTTNYYPGGSQTTIYSSDNSNLIADNALEDWTDVDTALQTLAAQTDPEGNKITIMPRQLITCFGKRATAMRVLGATEVRATTNTNNQTLGANVVASLVGGQLELVTSPRLDDYDDGDEWYIGDPKRGFIYREHWPFQSFRRQTESEDAFMKDVVEQWKFREWGTPHCIDHRFVVKNAVS